MKSFKLIINKTRLHILNLVFVCLFSGITGVYAQQQNLAIGKSVTANSENPQYPVNNAVDGKITRNSKWLSGNVKPPHILEVDLNKYCNISQVIIHTGIPEAERTPSESSQAAGFWSAKNFKLQYWDDANWTDIPNAEVHENRLTAVKFSFSPTINTYRLRFVCDDGEPISVMEFEVYGSETNRQAPVINTILGKKVERNADQDVSIKVEGKAVGKTMKYVGYNQGYYMPGSNASGWIEYSNVNSLRIWTTLNSYVPLNTIQVDKNIGSVEEFDKRKAELRANPQNNKFLKWDLLLPIYNNTEQISNTNPMVLNYVLVELKRLHIDPVIQISNTDFDETWSNKWQQWQRYYALAYYAAKEGDATMFAMQNEPNHRNSGPMKLDQWISGMQIVSDALKSAIEDVNKKYDKNLKAKMVGPVTAGNNPEWWTAVAKNMRTDYHGKTIDYDLIGLFSTHSYNSPAAGYANRVNDIRKIITDNHPAGLAPPIVYTEIGRWMNAYLIDKEETMDSPSLFTEWAGIYTNNTKNGAYGMWAFKFVNTISNVYQMGIKSGHHYTWQGQRIVEDAYTNVLAGRPVKTYNGSLAGMLTDGIKNDASAWRSDSAAAEKWIEIDLGQTRKLGSAVVYSGSAGGTYTSPDRIKNYRLQYFTSNSWADIPGTEERGNKYAQVFRTFSQPVETSRIRLISSDPGILKLREIKAFHADEGPREGESNFDVSGIQRTGQVVRLFAKGFKEERPMYKTIVSVDDENLDALTSYDAKTGNYYMWLVQRGKYKNNITIDLSSLPVPAGSIVTAETVGPASYGEVQDVLTVNGSKKISTTLPSQSVMLLTIPTGNLRKEIIKASADASVSGGKNAKENYGSLENLNISLDASKLENNRVSFIRFDLSERNPASVSRVLLKVNGYNSTDTSLVRYHVYGIPSAKWDEGKLTWDTAPQLDCNEALIREVGLKAHVAGELAMNNIKKDHYLDVTGLVKDHAGRSITFALIRETRQLGDNEDKDRLVRISSRESSNAPQLEIWTGSGQK